MDPKNQKENPSRIFEIAKNIKHDSKQGSTNSYNQKKEKEIKEKENKKKEEDIINNENRKQLIEKFKEKNRIKKEKEQQEQNKINPEPNLTKTQDTGKFINNLTLNTQNTNNDMLNTQNFNNTNQSNPMPFINNTNNPRKITNIVNNNNKNFINFPNNQTLNNENHSVIEKTFKKSQDDENDAKKKAYARELLEEMYLIQPQQSKDEEEGKKYFKEHYRKGLKQILVESKDKREKAEQEKALAAKKNAEDLKLLKQKQREKKKLKQEFEKDKDKENIVKDNDVILTTQKTNPNPNEIPDYDSENQKIKNSNNNMDINLNHNQNQNNHNQNNHNQNNLNDNQKFNKEEFDKIKNIKQKFKEKQRKENELKENLQNKLNVDNEMQLKDKITKTTQTKNTTQTKGTSEIQREMDTKNKNYPKDSTNHDNSISNLKNNLNTYTQHENKNINKDDDMKDVDVNNESGFNQDNENGSQKDSQISQIRNVDPNQNMINRADNNKSLDDSRSNKQISEISQLKKLEDHDNKNKKVNNESGIENEMNNLNININKDEDFISKTYVKNDKNKENKNNNSFPNPKNKNNQIPTNNNQIPTTNNQIPTTNNQIPTTNNQIPTKTAKAPILPNPLNIDTKNIHLKYILDHPNQFTYEQIMERTCYLTKDILVEYLKESNINTNVFDELSLNSSYNESEFDYSNTSLQQSCNDSDIDSDECVQVEWDNDHFQYVNESQMSIYSDSEESDQGSQEHDDEFIYDHNLKRKRKYLYNPKSIQNIKNSYFKYDNDKNSFEVLNQLRGRNYTARIPQNYDTNKLEYFGLNNRQPKRLMRIKRLGKDEYVKYQKFGWIIHSKSIVNDQQIKYEKVRLMRNRLIKQKIITKDKRASDVYGIGFNKWVDPCIPVNDNDENASQVSIESEKEDEMIDQVINHKNSDDESEQSDDLDQDEGVDVDARMGINTQDQAQKVQEEHDFISQNIKVKDALKLNPIIFCSALNNKNFLKKSEELNRLQQSSQQIRLGESCKLTNNEYIFQQLICMPYERNEKQFKNKITLTQLSNEKIKYELMTGNQNKKKENKSKQWHPFLVRLYHGCSLEIKVEKWGTKKGEFANVYLQMGNNL